MVLGINLSEIIGEIKANFKETISKLEVAGTYSTPQKSAISAAFFY